MTEKLISTDPGTFTRAGRKEIAPGYPVTGRFATQNFRSSEFRPPSTPDQSDIK